MEPMNLGSPTSSPSNTTPTMAYLPSFLMGESQTPNSRSNTLSPAKTGARSVSFSFANTPTTVGGHNSLLAIVPTDYNRSILNQKSLFNNNQEAPSFHSTPNAAQRQQQSITAAGPPIQGLFDSLRIERNQVQTPKKVQCANQSNMNYHFNQSMTMEQQQEQEQLKKQQQQQHLKNFNDTTTGYLFNNSLNLGNNNLTRTTSLTHLMPNSGCDTPNQSILRYNDFWITVYGFPNTATTAILQHFSQCGTIIDKVSAPLNGNWIHIKYSSRLECDKALNYHEKILFNNVMIGVTLCKDKSILLDKENLCENNVMENSIRVRPLAQTAYKNAQNNTSVIRTNCTAQKSSGLVNKALDLFFGW